MTTRRRSLLVVIITLMILCSFITGCGSGNDYDHESKEMQVDKTEIPGLILIECISVEGTRLKQLILYDPETFIMYSYVEWFEGGGFLEMHNADGTPRIYNPTE